MMQKPEAKKKSSAAKDKAWTYFIQQFPNADVSKFVSQVYVDEKNKFSAEVFFKEGPGSLQSVFGSDRKYWSERMKNALGLVSVSGFPSQLSPRQNKTPLLIPAIDFTDKAPSLRDIFNDRIKIYITPDSFFETRFRDIFQGTRLRHTTAAESKKWLSGPNMQYWSQQLNFAVFCATQGCGISREIFDSGLALPPEIRAFFKFHVYFTVRRILYQMGGIQSVSALPGDQTFNELNNHYDEASFKRICNEFGISSSSDFRFTHEKNNGLGNVFIYATGAGPTKTEASYPGFYNFSDEGGKVIKGNLIYFIEPDIIDHYDWFALSKASGLTQAGLARINQSIEAFVYCVLGAQVNVRSSILGEGGRAKEAQSEFLVLMEDVIRQPDLAKSVQRYQLVVDESKVRLNLAVCPGAWLMLSRMIINVDSTTGYDNELKQVVAGMKLGVNNSVNQETKRVGVKLMDGGGSKVKRPTGHPSNPIEQQSVKQSKKQSQTENEKPGSNITDNHETLKVSAFLIYRFK